MGHFNSDQPNARPVGFSRFAQVLKRDWKRFFLVNLLTLLTLIPFTAGVIVSVLTSSLLVLIPACIFGGIIAGPGIACMYDCILRSLRDNSDDWWYNYKKAFKQNLGASMMPGVFLCLFLGFVAFACFLLPMTVGSAAVLLFSVIIVTMVFTVWWPQIVLFNQRPVIQLKNCLFFSIQHLWRNLAAAALQIAWWVVMALFLPWSALLLPLLGLWFILYTSVFILYDKLDRSFRIEAQIAEYFPEQALILKEE